MRTINTSKLTDDEVIRLERTVYNRMRSGGGSCYGIDRPTMRIVHPHLLQWLDALRATRQLRSI